jgi:hypothetical protein
MNKLISDGPYGKNLLCILEPSNISRLREGKPITFSLNSPDLFPAGLPAKLSIEIAYSETPIADARDIAKTLKPGAVFTDRRTPKLETSRPHCPECSSTIEQLGVWRSDSPVWLVFCTQCGCTLGTMPPVASMEKSA